jgi:hypothetical protein
MDNINNFSVIINGSNSVEFLLNDIENLNNCSLFNLKIVNLLLYELNIIGTLNIFSNNKLEKKLNLVPGITIPFDFDIRYNKIKFNINLFYNIKEIIFKYSPCEKPV